MSHDVHMHQGVPSFHALASRESMLARGEWNFMTRAMPCNGAGGGRYDGQNCADEYWYLFHAYGFNV